MALGADENGAKCVNQYVKRQKLASGSYGKVSLYRSRENGKLFAVKVLNKPQLERKRVSRSASALSDVFHEARRRPSRPSARLTRAQISLLRALDHPNIVRLEEARARARARAQAPLPHAASHPQVIDDANEPKIYVVMEYLSRGPVHSEGRAPRLRPPSAHPSSAPLPSRTRRLRARWPTRPRRSPFATGRAWRTGT